MAGTGFIAPTGANDTEGARRVFEEFFTVYQPIFTQVEVHLGSIIKESPTYAKAYIPWQKALNELSKGIFFINKKIPLTNPKNFLDALKMFSLESVIQFLEGICENCQIKLERDWAKKFHEHINLLLFSFAILQRRAQPELSR